MDIIVVTPPPVYPVTAAEAFFHLKLSTDPLADVTAEPEYDEVMRLIATSTEECEGETRRAFVQQTLRLVRGPAAADGSARRAWGSMFGARAWGDLELLRPPLISLDTVKYYDDANVLQTVDEKSYFVVESVVPKVRFVDGFAFPSTYIREDAIQLTYVVGYPVVPADGDTPADYRANVPAAAKSAILLGLNLKYDSLTEDQRVNIERARQSLLDRLAVPRA